jgi:CheY-like chemotaxis protein
MVLGKPAGYYDLVLMDVQMPVLNGHDATRKIRASGHPGTDTLPIIAMTANAFSEDVTLAQEAGMNGHLSKPIDINKLYRTIASNIAKK